MRAAKKIEIVCDSLEVKNVAGARDVLTKTIDEHAPAAIEA